jgi:hypothetical protein
MRITSSEMVPRILDAIPAKVLIAAVATQSFQGRNPTAHLRQGLLTLSQ